MEIMTPMTAMRKRPAMYIGSLKDYGLRTVLENIAEAFLDQAGTHSSEMAIVFEDASWFRFRITCAEPCLNPSVFLPQSGMDYSDMQIMLAGALSTAMQFTNADNGHLLFETKDGIEHYKTAEAPFCRSLELRFQADMTIFGELQLDYDFYCTRFRKMAYLNTATTITFKDNRKQRHDCRVLHYPEGIHTYLVSLHETISHHHYPLHYAEETIDGRTYRFAFSLQFWDDVLPLQKSFVNYLHVYENGSLVQGFFDALAATMRKLAPQPDTKNEFRLNRKQLLRQVSVICAYSGNTTNIAFEGPTKRKLNTPYMRKEAAAAITPHLENWLHTMPNEADILFSRHLDEKGDD